MDTRAAGTTPVTKKRSTIKKLALSAAVAVPTAALLAASVSAGPSSAAGNGDDTKAPSYGVSKAAQRATDVAKCDGGVQKRVWNRGAPDWIYTTSDGGATVLPGSNIRIKGPSSGTDVLSVDLGAQAYLSPGSTGYVKVLVDGIPMRPSNGSTGSSYEDYSNDYYGTFAQNYCRKIGPGYHDFQVVLVDNDFGQAGNYYFELHDPMVNVEQAE
jgi:uncharacterized membrane protein